jgi:predicted oxidoreductase
VVGRVSAHVVEVVQCFSKKGTDVIVIDRIKDLIARTPGAYQPDGSQFGEVMGYRRR